MLKLEEARKVYEWAKNLDVPAGIRGLPNSAEYTKMASDYLKEQIERYDSLPDVFKLAYSREWLRRHKDMLKEHGIEDFI